MQESAELTLWPADFLASHSVRPGTNEAKKMTATSGRKCIELLTSYGPIGLLAKMLLESSIWHSTKCLMTWKISNTPAGRLLFQLVPLVHHISGRELLFLHTPTANDCKPAGKKEIAMMTKYLNGENVPNTYIRLRSQLAVLEGRYGAPNPEYLEWMMGYPTGWTEIEHLETP